MKDYILKVRTSLWILFYYESRKREVKRLINEGRCDERLKSKVEESTCLTSDGKNLRFTTVWQGKLVQTLMLWAYAK